MKIFSEPQYVVNWLALTVLAACWVAEAKVPPTDTVVEREFYLGNYGADRWHAAAREAASRAAATDHQYRDSSTSS